ncbi:hypothetical protein WJX81_004633 [Elliptochloris bilobata]|uniref:Glycosyltransferase 61 catalytic domain-containing protein n=1 Tax=Elliptochloris bilobata TaxID=381761 RepID=A0AAW1SAB5_9CHLO
MWPLLCYALAVCLAAPCIALPPELHCLPAAGAPQLCRAERFALLPKQAQDAWTTENADDPDRRLLRAHYRPARPRDRKDGPAERVPDPLIAGYFGAISIAVAPRAAGVAACASLDLGGTPLVVLARDWTGLWHFLTVQLLAAHRALRALGLDPRRPFRLLFADRPGYATDRRNRLAEDWDALAGAPSLHMSALPPGGLCADDAVLGANAAGMDVVDLDAYAPEAPIAALRPAIRDFRAWVLSRLRVPPPALWAARGAPGRTLTLTLVDRGRAAKRRLVDQEAVAAAARARGFSVRVVDFEPLRLREQLEVLRSTDVLLGVHGGALPLVMFLPRGAVGVEVLPFKQHAGATHDFTFGYCNWARAAGAQHLVWHARSASQVVQATFEGSAGPGDFKHHHVRLGAADAAALLDAAAALFRAGPACPGAGQCVYANEPLF